MSRTLLALLVAAAGPWVGELRARYDPSAKLGSAPHITLVYPFFDSEDPSESRLRRLDDMAATHSDLTFGLDRIAALPSTVWSIAIQSSSSDLHEFRGNGIWSLSF